MRETRLSLNGLVSLADVMQAFDAGRWMNLSSLISGQKATATGKAAEAPVGEIAPSMRVVCEQLTRDCAALQLKTPLATLARLDALLERPNCTWGETSRLFSELMGRVTDEFAFRQFFVIDDANSELWLSPQPFGAEVASRFPSAREDIEEAAKCVALGRSTAAVFHLVRVLERALHALGRSLNYPELTTTIEGRNWEDILGTCRTELKKQNRDRVAAWSAEPVFYADAVQRLIAIKEAWRNEVMHVRPQGYNEQQAREIWALTDGFMRHLATKLAE